MTPEEGSDSALELGSDEIAVLRISASVIATAQAVRWAPRADSNIDIGNIVASAAAAATSIAAS